MKKELITYIALLITVVLIYVSIITSKNTYEIPKMYPIFDTTGYEPCQEHLGNFKLQEVKNTEFVYFIARPEDMNYFLGDAKKLRIKYNILLKRIDNYNKEIDKINNLQIIKIKGTK